MVVRSILIYSFITLILSVNIGITQAQLRIKKLQIEEGASIVRCIHRDQDGYLWLGTNGFGIIKYDGVNNKRFIHIDKGFLKNAQTKKRPAIFTY